MTLSGRRGGAHLPRSGGEKLGCRTWKLRRVRLKTMANGPLLSAVPVFRTTPGHLAARGARHRGQSQRTASPEHYYCFSGDYVCSGHAARGSGCPASARRCPTITPGRIAGSPRTEANQIQEGLSRNYFDGLAVVIEKGTLLERSGAGALCPMSCKIAWPKARRPESELLAIAAAWLRPASAEIPKKR